MNVVLIDFRVRIPNSTTWTLVNTFSHYFTRFNNFCNLQSETYPTFPTDAHIVGVWLASRSIQNFWRQFHHSTNPHRDAVQSARVLAVCVRQPLEELSTIRGVVVCRTLLRPEIYSICFTWLANKQRTQLIWNFNFLRKQKWR